MCLRSLLLARAGRGLDQRGEQRRVALEVHQRLGVPLHAEIPVAATTPSGDDATARNPRPSRSTAWWWNEFTSSSSTPTISASWDAPSTATVWVGSRPDSFWRCVTEPSVTSGRC